MESHLLETAIAATRAAGEFLLQSVGSVKFVGRKEGQARNLVSEIDKGSEERIIAMIREQFPGHAILAEESGAHDIVSEYKWIIDPLDGTTNFLHGVPIFSATVAVEYRGELVAGATYDPNHDEMFTAIRGGGAYRNGKRLAVSAVSTMIEGLMVTGFPYDLAGDPDRALDHFCNFTRVSQGIRRLGSAAIDLAYVAAGRFDGYWEVALNPWDMAAGILLVNEAGGTTSDFSGRPKSIYQKQMLATNGKIHRQCLDILAKGAAGEKTAHA